MKKEQPKKRMWQWDNKEHRVLEGEYRGVFRGVGIFRSTIFHIMGKQSGKIETIWGNLVIDRALRDKEIGSYVKIIYKGIKIMKGTKGDNGKPKKNFDFDITVRAPKKPMGKSKSGGQKR